MSLRILVASYNGEVFPKNQDNMCVAQPSAYTEPSFSRNDISDLGVSALGAVRETLVYG